MNGENWMTAATQAQVVEEARELKRKFKAWLATEEAREILKNLFQVFGSVPVVSATELDYARFAGRMEVLHYILKHGEIFGGNGNG